MDYDVLVKLLRENAGVAAASDRPEYAASYNHASDAIVALQARVAELTKEVSAQMAAVMNYSGMAGLNLGRAERAEAELAAARAECLRRQTIIGEVALERDAARALLPGVYYMDPPDGGQVEMLEQLRRMAKDAARYRWLRNNAVREKPLGDKYIEFHCDFETWNDVDAAIDAAMQEKT